MIRNRLPYALAALLALSAPALAQEYTSETFTGGQSTLPGATTQVHAPGRDDVTASVTLPFAFPYFGRNYTQISVCTNGWLALGSTTSTLSDNPVLPATAQPNAVIAPLWDDLTTGTGSVRSFTLGRAPDRTFVVAWEGVSTFSAVAGSMLNFQVHLHETSGVIELTYSAGGSWGGLSYTAGIEDDTGTVAFGAPNTANDNSGQPALDHRFTPRQITLSGRLLRDRPVADETGLGNSTEFDLPVVGVDVDVVREDTGEVIATGLTDAQGDFRVTVLAVEDPITLAVDLKTSGSGARVVSLAGVPYARRLAFGVSGAESFDIGTKRFDAAFDNVDASLRRALNIQQAAARGNVWAAQAADFGARLAPPATPASFATLEFVWHTGVGVPGGTRYTPASPTGAARVDVNDSNTNPDPYDDDVILRAYGHHVLASISVHPGRLPFRSWTAASGAEFAFADGFAHWFAAVVQGRSRFIDTRTATTADVFDLELPEPAATGDGTTGAIAASLHDLVDPANEAHDEYEGSTQGFPSQATEVFTTVDRDLGDRGATQAPLIGGFFDNWRDDREANDRVITARNFIHHGTLPDDSFEPNDVAGSEAAFPTGVSKLTGLTLSPFNEDRFSFQIASLTDSIVSVSAQQTGATDFELEILDGAGATLAMGTTVGLEDKSSLRVTTPDPVPAATYVARVNWVDGVAGSYSLSFSRPLVLLPSVLPDWTEGRPFKQDFVADGGVAPYTFAQQHSVPGLAATLSGTQLSGTPTAAGDYSVQVTITDTDSPATQSQSNLSLRINPPLSLPAVFGVREDQGVNVNLARGGTTAAWTSLTMPPLPFALADGASLQLTGGPGTPQTFPVSASAVDAVGATLADTTTQVVVCAEVGRRTTGPLGTGSHLGLFFGALAGSSASLEIRFVGTGATPRLHSMLDESGKVLAFVQETGDPIVVRTLVVVDDQLGSPRLTERGRKFRFDRLALSRSGHVFLIFVQQDADKPFVGSFTSTTRVKSKKRDRGQVAVGPSPARVEIAFEAIGGSVLRATAERGPAPTKLRPRIVEIVDPTGVSVMPKERFSRGRTKVSIRTKLGPNSGTYKMLLASDSENLGPVNWTIRLRVPKDAELDLD